MGIPSSTLILVMIALSGLGLAGDDANLLI